MNIDIEELKAIFFDKDALREPPYRLRRFNDRQGVRWYFETDDFNRYDFYISTTSKIDVVVPANDNLVRWKEELGPAAAKLYMNQKASYGTAMHILIAHFLLNMKIILLKDSLISILDSSNYDFKHWEDDWVYELQNDLTSFAKFANEVELKPIAIEVCLRSKNLKMAGAIDLVCTMNFNRKRVNAIIDFKSSRKNYEDIKKQLQLKYYQMMWEENFPEFKIDYLFNWKPKDFKTENVTYDLVNQTDKISEEICLSYNKIYDATNSHKPKANVKLFNGELVLGRNTDNVKFLSIEELLNQKLQHTPTTTQQIEEDISAYEFDDPFSATSKTNNSNQTVLPLSINYLEDF